MLKHRYRGRTKMSKLNIASLQKNNVFPFGIGVAKNAFPNLSGIQKFGFNDTVGTSFETIQVGSANFVYPTTAATASVVSDETTDDDGDTGARTVLLQGLDNDYNIITETVTMDGTNPVTTDASFLRIFRMSVETAGSSEGCDGTITASIGGNVQATIDPEYDNQTLQAAYTVPAGKRGYLTRLHITSTKDNKAAMVGVFVRKPGSVFQIKYVVEVYRNEVTANFDIPIVVDQKSDIEIRGKNLNTGNVSIGSAFDLLLEDK